MNTLSNKEVAAMFDLLADLMTIADENPFKIKGYSIASFRISKLTSPLLEMSEQDIRKIENIGPAVVSMIEELKATNKLNVLEQYLKATPPGIIELLRIKGLGAKKVRQLWLELEIESIGELAQACEENRLATIKGFGKKTQENIYQSIQYIQASKGKVLLAQVYDWAHDFHQNLQAQFPQNKFYLVGDIVRQMNEVECVEWISDLSFEVWKGVFDTYSIARIEANENTLMIVIEGFPKIKISKISGTQLGLQLLQANASKAFFDTFCQDFTLANNLTSEESIFESCELPFIIPALRETQNYADLVAAKKHFIPIQESDIKGLIHCHSTWSDGVNTLEEMAKACIAKGLEYMVITDHSMVAFYAQGLEPERIIAQHQEIAALNKKLHPFRIFKGIEADILGQGDLDYNESIWKSFEIIIASVHSNLRMDAEKANERILKVLDNPFVKILGHSTGRLLLSRQGYPVDLKLVIDKCAQNNIVIELNANPRRLDLDWTWINYALDQGVKISINPDAHSIKGIDDIRFGVLSAQKSLLSPEQNLSSFGLEKFFSYFNLSPSY